MNTKQSSTSEAGRPLSRNTFLLILIASIAPSLIWFGQALTGVHGWGPTPQDTPDVYGQAIHIFMNTVGVCTAFFVSFLCFAHFARSGDVTTPLLGVGMLCAGFMDLWRNLAAAEILLIRTPQDAFQPFAWTLSRGFYALVLVATTSMFLVTEKVRGDANRQRGVGITAVVGLALAALASLIMLVAAQFPALVAHMYSGKLDQLMWNTAPLVMLSFIGLYLMPTYYRWHPSVFTQTLWLSCIALALAQVHFLLNRSMPFAQREHTLDVLVIVGYAIPLLGMLMDYHRTYQHNEKTLRKVQSDLLMLNQSAQARSQEHEFVEAVLSALPDAACIMDSSLRITRANPALASMTGLKDPFMAIGKTLPSLLGAQGAVQESHGLKAIETCSEVQSPPVEMVAADGQKRRLSWIHKPVADSRNRVVALVGIARPS